MPDLHRPDVRFAYRCATCRFVHDNSDDALWCSFLTWYYGEEAWLGPLIPCSRCNGRGVVRGA